MPWSSLVQLSPGKLETSFSLPCHHLHEVLRCFALLWTSISFLPQNKFSIEVNKEYKNWGQKTQIWIFSLFFFHYVIWGESVNVSKLSLFTCKTEFLPHLS